MKQVEIAYTITQSEILTRCLILAITAPTDEKARMASDLAEQIAQGLTKKQTQTYRRGKVAYCQN